MGKDDKKDDKKGEDKGPMAGCPVPVVKVDEAKLLNDCRSPRFFKACQKLQIDPLDLRPREFESFGEPGLLHEKQQIRMAMYERQRLSKWQTINDVRFALPKGDKLPARSQSAELFRTSTDNFASTHIAWLPAERARTMQQARNGKVEVLKSTAKRLRDITAVGDYASQEREEQKQKAIEAKLAAERKRKEMIKKDQEKEALRKEKMKKERKAQEEREQQQRELDENLQAKLKALQESWDAESAEKQRRQKEQLDRVQQNLAEADRKREEEVQKLLQGFERKEQQVVKMRDAIMHGGGDVAGVQELAAKAQQKRDDIARAAEAHTKSLIVKHQQKEAEQKVKEAARQEKIKELAKERKEREQEARKRMADIQKKKKEILKDREDKVLEHMEKVEANLKANRERLSKELEIKAELEKIKYEQAKDNVAREKAKQRQAARELEELHHDLSDIKKVRDDALDKLKRERQLQATKIRLHKDELKEEVFLIQVQNSWNKAHKMLNSWEKEGVVPPLPAHH